MVAKKKTKDKKLSNDFQLFIGMGILFFLSVLIVIMIVATSLNKNLPNNSSKSFTSENVTVVDNNRIVQSELPDSVPVEYKNVTQSVTSDYPDRKTTLYTVVYTSTKQQEELRTIYNNFLKKNGYVIKVNKPTTKSTIFSATKNKNDITIIITPQGVKMQVHIDYVSRQQ
jgi:cytoskeletal protein RodZ